MGNVITKKTLIIIIAIVVIGWFALSAFNEPSGTETGNQTATTTTVVAKATTTVKKTTAPVPVASQPVTMSYQKALETYKDNLRLQLSGADFCQVSPNNVMYKNGTSIMIDNRSAKTRNIKIGSTAYSIEGYGFKIVRLSSGTLPATLLMDCGTQQNIAKILLQK